MPVLRSRVSSDGHAIMLIREALEDLVNRGSEAIDSNFALLDQSPPPEGASPAVAADPTAPSLDALIGGGVTPLADT